MIVNSAYFVKSNFLELLLDLFKAVHIHYRHIEGVLVKLYAEKLFFHQMTLFLT